MNSILLATIHEFKKLQYNSHFSLLLVSYSIIIMSCFAFVFGKNTSNDLQLLLLTNVSFIFLLLTKFYHIARLEIAQGKLEYLLTIHNPTTICVSKMTATFISALPAIIVQNIFLHLNATQELQNYIICTIPAQLLLIFECSAIAVISIAIQAYFRNNFSILNIILSTFIIPAIILMSTITLENYGSITLVMLGVTFVTTPCLILGASYLFANIYSFD